MYKYIAKGITNGLINEKVVSERDREIYEYSFEVLLSTGAIIAVILIASMFFKCCVNSLLFMAGFILTRRISGGYHASKHIYCFLTTIANYGLYVLAVKRLSVNLIPEICIILAVFSLFAVCALAPVEDRNKPLSNKEKIRFRKQSRVFITSFFLVVTGLILKKIALINIFSFTTGVSSVSTYLVFGTIKNKLYNGPNFEIQRCHGVALRKFSGPVDSLARMNGEDKKVYSGLGAE